MKAQSNQARSKNYYYYDIVNSASRIAAADRRVLGSSRRCPKSEDKYLGMCLARDRGVDGSPYVVDQSHHRSRNNWRSIFFFDAIITSVLRQTLLKGTDVQEAATDAEDLRVLPMAAWLAVWSAPLRSLVHSHGYRSIDIFHEDCVQFATASLIHRGRSRSDRSRIVEFGDLAKTPLRTTKHHIPFSWVCAATVRGSPRV